MILPLTSMCMLINVIKIKYRFLHFYSIFTVFLNICYVFDAKIDAKIYFELE
jgi:hypothetical protein